MYLLLYNVKGLYSPIKGLTLSRLKQLKQSNCSFCIFLTDFLPLASLLSSLSFCLNNLNFNKVVVLCAKRPVSKRFHSKAFL